MKSAPGLLSALDEPIFDLGLDGLIAAATPAAYALLESRVPAGASKEPLSGLMFAELVATRDRARFEQAFKRIAEAKANSHRLELGIILGSSAASDLLPMEAKLGVITAANGKPIGVGLWLRDLSLEKANEAAANVQGTHLLDLVENISDACVVESADGSVEMLNEAFCRLFQISEAPQSLVGTSCADLFESASAATDKRIGPLYFPLDAKTGSNQRDELEFQLVSGEMVAQASLAVDGETGTAGRLHLFHPIVARETPAVSDGPSDGTIAVQMALIEKITRELVEAYESAGCAVYRAEQIEMSGQSLERLRRVEAAAASALDSVAGLLDFSRIEGGPITLDALPFFLRDSVALMIAGVVSLAERRHVLLRVRIEQDVPEQLTGDAPRLMLALRNLLECAILAFPDVAAAGTPAADDKPTEVTLSISPEYTAERQIHLSFVIEQTVRPGTSRLKLLAPAATMQLAFSRQVVRALIAGSQASDGQRSGRLEVLERKSGTTYQFTSAFPFDPANPPYPRPTFLTLTALPILIVSASVEERKQLAEMTKSWRMAPREADDANVALELLARLAKEEQPIPLVITSNRLGAQDGFLLAFRIKQQPALRQTAIIMLAADGRPGDSITCRENGISAYLRQPVVPQQLNEAIAAVIGAHDDDASTSTLITRHSLREQKKASVLIIDAERDKVMFAAASLKRRDYRLVIVSSAEEAFGTMAQEQFDVIVVDPNGAGFVEGINIVATLNSRVGEGRELPRILLASDSPPSGKTAYAGVVAKPFAKNSLLNAVVGLGLGTPG